MARKVIIVGTSGYGKSSTGNTILGKETFETGDGMESVTQTCKWSAEYREDRNCRFTVVDTPGLFDTDQPLANRALEIQKALEICPHPHAFLIVFRIDKRFTYDDLRTVDLLRIIFGEAVLDHAILVFTRGERFNTKLEFYQALNKSNALLKLKHECNERIIRIKNNSPTNDAQENSLTNELFDCIDNMSDIGTRCYQHDSLSKHRTCLENHLKNRKSEIKIDEELEQLVKALGGELEPGTWRPYLLGGAAGAVLTAAAPGLVVLGAPAAIAEGVAAAAAASPAAAGFVSGAIQAAGSALQYAGTAVGGYLRFRRF